MRLPRAPGRRGESASITPADPSRSAVETPQRSGRAAQETTPRVFHWRTLTRNMDLNVAVFALLLNFPCG